MPKSVSCLGSEEFGDGQLDVLSLRPRGSERSRPVWVDRVEN